MNNIRVVPFYACKHGIPGNCAACAAFEPDIKDTEYDADSGDGLVSSGGECPGCRRIMSVRERNEQGVCDDCRTQ